LVEKICDYCKKPFEVPNYKKDRARFCSRTCGGRSNKGKHPSAETRKKLSDAQKRPFKTGRIKNVELICEYCKKPFKTYNYYKDKKRFCSNKCRVNAIKAGMIHRHYSEDGLRRISQARKGKHFVHSKNFTSTKVQIICEICKKSFEVDNYRKTEARFCSRVCCGKANEGHIPWNKGKTGYLSENAKNILRATQFKKGDIPRNKNSTTLHCEVCNKEFQVPECRKNNAKFCSNKCRGIWISKNINGDKIYNYKEKIKKICIECGKEFYIHPYRNEECRFCCIKCYGAWQSKNRTAENSYSWIDGRSYYPYCKKFNNRLKERVRNRDNRTCQLCCSKEDGIKLAIHHVHYDKENCYPDLISLCRTCNSKVNKISERKFYEKLFMNKLNERGLLFWVKQNDK